MSENYSTLSVIVPCYNEEESLPYFYKAICEAAERLSALRFELLFVDDGSKDGTLAALKSLAAKDERVRYISFSRNFGKEAALLAGLENCTGELIAVMDADMQDPPTLLDDMYRAITEEDYDIAAARRTTRKGEPPVRSAFARCFYKIMGRISDADVVDGARDFRMMRRCVRDAIVSLGEYCRFSKGIFSWVGFKTKWIAYENVERVAGVTKWSFWKLLRYSIEGMIAFSSAPLAYGIIMGGLMLGAAAITLICAGIGAGISGAGFSAAAGICALVLAVGGLNLLGIGISAQYIARIHREVRRRPVYIVREKN